MSAREPQPDPSFEALRSAHRSERAPQALRRRVLGRPASGRSKGSGARPDERRNGRWMVGAALALAGGLWLGLLHRGGGDGERAGAAGARSDRAPGAEPAGQPPSAEPPSAGRCSQPLPTSPWNPSEVAVMAKVIGLHGESFETWTACGPLTRRYLVRDRVAADVLIVLHDAGHSAELAQIPTRWWFEDLQERTGVQLVYANGGPVLVSGLGKESVHAGVWQTDEGAHPAVDDADYLRGIVEDLRAKGRVGQDGDVFLAGYGSGAVMALAAAARHPERYAGVAAFSPTRPLRRDELEGPLPASRGRRLRSVLVVLPAVPGVPAEDTSPLAWRWAEPFGSAPGFLRVMRQAPGMDRIDAALGGGLELRILRLDAEVDPFPLPGGGDPITRAASEARPFFFDGPGAAWDFFQRSSP